MLAPSRPALRDQLVHLCSGIRAGGAVVNLSARSDILDMTADCESLLQGPHVGLPLGRQEGS